MGVLLDAVKSDFEPGKALWDTFYKVADLNLKRREKENQDILKMADLGIREQKLQLAKEHGLLTDEKLALQNTMLSVKNTEEHNRVAESNNFAQALQQATKNGKTIFDQLKSSDPDERAEAANVANRIVIDYSSSDAPVVKDGVKRLFAYPDVVAKQKMAEQKAFDQQTAREARDANTKRGLDIREGALNETITHHGVTEGIGQQNANTRKAGTDLRVAATNRKADLEANGIKLPTGNRMTVDEVRKTLAKGSLPTATPQEKTDASTLESNLRRIPSGEKDVMGNPKYRTDIPIDQWRFEGRSQLNLPPPPGFGDMRTQEAKDAPQSSPNPMDVLPDTSGPANPVDSILRKYKIPTSRPQSMADPQPAADLLNTTQNFLADLGVAPAPAAAPVGFGGFGLPSA